MLMPLETDFPRITGLVLLAITLLLLSTGRYLKSTTEIQTAFN